MSDDHLQQSEKHRSLYFMDGNIVLLAPRPDQPPLLFRVHKSVLSSHSSIFSDMFDVCSRSGGMTTSEIDPLYDGVPLVHMPDDANHLQSILEILYYQSTLPWTPHSPHYPVLVTPILELSRKYGIDRMREQILGHLTSDWPQTLKDWDKLEKNIEIMMNDPDVRCIDDHFPEPASAIRLARQFDIPNILPAAFYHLSRLSIQDDWDKMRADPVLRNKSLQKRTAQWGVLSAKDLRCLLLGRAEIPDMVRGYIKPGDLRHNSGRTDCNGAEELWKDMRDKCLQSADPLALLKSSVDLEANKTQRCPSCFWALRTKIQALRVQIWDKLGDLFHLEDE